MEFQEKIRLLRKEAGLTQKAVAQAVGVTDRTYQNYEAGESFPSGAVLSKMAALFGVRMELLTDTAQRFMPAEMDGELAGLLSEMQALFAGGKVAEEDKKYVLDALTEAYFIAKKKAREKKGGLAGESER